MIDETVEEIRDMRTHSSSVVAVKATRALAELADREFHTVEEFERDLERNARVLRRANPTHASLHTAMGDVQEQVTEASPPDVSAARKTLLDAIESIVDEIEVSKRRAAEEGAKMLADGETVLTHDYSTTVLEAIELAVGEGNRLDVFATESRPRFLGRRTARRLAGVDGVDATLIVDSAGGHFLPECDRVVVGMSCIVDDALYNRVGTFQLAAAAARLDVPFTVLGSSSKIVTEGFVFENEFRSASEVMREPAEGFSIANPLYDETPLDFVTDVVTEDGQRSF